MTEDTHAYEPALEELKQILEAKGWMLATCESCTGGLLGDWITNLAGSSTFYLGGVQSYSNEVKHGVLGVPQSVLEKDGAVSYACAAAMAEGGRRLLGADVCLSVTGIAGPGGGTDEKPVGLVYIGVSSSLGTAVKRFIWSGDRVENKRSSALGALKLAVHYLQDGGNI